MLPVRPRGTGSKGGGELDETFRGIRSLRREADSLGRGVVVDFEVGRDAALVGLAVFAQIGVVARS